MATAETRSLRLPSPESNVGVTGLDANVSGPTTRQPEPPGRKRIRRACDKCSNSRTRCDGNFPCQHCANYGFTCSYDREHKPRGRAASKRMRVESTATTTSNLHGNSNQLSSSSTETITPTSSDFIEAGGLRASEGRPSYSTTNGRQQGPSTNQPVATSDQDRRDSSNTDASNLYNPRPEYQRLPDYLQIQQQNMASTPNFHSLYFDDTNYNNFSHFDYYGAAIPSFQTAIYSTVGNQVNQASEIDALRFSATPMDRSRIRPISRIDFVVPRTPQYRPPTAFGKSPSADDPAGQGCRYVVLVPLLQHINSFLPTSIACDLLDLYFAEPSSSLFESASPYILTHIFRKKSFLHATKPRTTSAALLAAMLWATAQTSDAQIFKTSPTSRARICDRLFATCLRLLNPMLYESPRRSEQLPTPERSHNGAVRDGIQTTGTLDDVLTLTLIGIVVSGGDFKHDCLKWWRATWALAKELKLGQEVGEASQHTLGNPDSPYEGAQSSTQGDSTYGIGGGSTTEEEKEERRRTWWLLFIADRHLALSFNTPLNILEAECHLYQPLDDATWQDFDPDYPKDRYFGPSTKFTGPGLFEFFLPLMVILGDIVDIHHRSYHPRFGALENIAAINQVESLLEEYEKSLNSVGHSPSSSLGHSNTDFQPPRLPNIHSQFNLPHSPPAFPPSFSTEARTKIVIAYATHILHVLHILLHGKWDPISMLDDLDHWTTSSSFVKCASHSVSAAEAVSQILKFDPELSFMPYLFGIYLLHGSFILLLFADKMQIEANPTVRQACETMIRAHEVCVATLNTEYQRNFRKVLRSALYDARGIVSVDIEEQRIKRREFLSLYRWANNGVGLAL